MIIDTHAHVYPKTYLDEMEWIGVDPATTKIARDLRASDELDDMRARLKMMEVAGVDTQVLSLTPQLPTTAGNASEAARVVKMGNDIYAWLIKDYPGKFMAYGAMPLPHVKESLEAVHYCLDTLGFQGMATNPIIGGNKHPEEISIPATSCWNPFMKSSTAAKPFFTFIPPAVAPAAQWSTLPHWNG